MVKNHIIILHHIFIIILHQTFTTSSPNLHHIITKPSPHHHHSSPHLSKVRQQFCQQFFHNIFQKFINKLWITHLSQFFQHIFIKVLRNICQQFFLQHLHQGLAQHLQQTFTTSSPNLHHIFNASFKSLSTNYGSQHLSQFCQQFFHNIFIKVFQHICQQFFHNSSPHHHTSCIISSQFFTKPSQFFTTSPKHVLVDLFLMKCY